MKVFIFIISSWFSIALLAQEEGFVFTQFKHRNGEISSEGYLRNGKPDGYWKTFNEQGQLVSEGNRKDFLLDGIWKFYTDGNLTSEVSYKEGKRNGISKTYTVEETVMIPYKNDLIVGIRETFFKNGNIKQRTPFENGMEQGIEFDFSQEGDITGITEYRRGFITSRQRINRRDRNGLKQGAWKFFYPDLIVQMEGTFLNDKKNGFFKYYDSLGNLTDVKKFTNGEEETQAQELAQVEVKTEYHPDGTPKLTAVYKNGVLEGVAREFDETGKIVKGVVFQEGRVVAQGIVDDRGRFQDNWQEFYPNGALKAEGRYRNGRRVGIWKFYFPNGTLEQEGNFNNQGEHHGEWIWYHPNGQKHIVQNYEKGLQDGKYREFADDGKTIISEGDYIEGERHGNWVINTGIERSEGRYRNGERHGRWKIYSVNNGQLTFEGSFVDGIPNGKHTYFQENGKILEEGTYSMGHLNGVWRKYDENGQLFVTITYRNDDEIRYDNIRTDAHIKR
jgi:antitoxin component YwqK of YwqJK toxin-antitoxin module